MITVTWGSDHALAYQNATSVRVLGARELGLPLDVAFAELGQGSLSALDRVLQTGEVLEMRHREVRILNVHGEALILHYVVAPLGLGAAARRGGHDRGGRHLRVPGRAIRQPGDAGHRDHRADERQRRPRRRAAGADRPAGARRGGPRRGLRISAAPPEGGPPPPAQAVAFTLGTDLLAAAGPPPPLVAARRPLAVGCRAGRRAHGPHRVAASPRREPSPPRRSGSRPRRQTASPSYRWSSPASWPAPAPAGGRVASALRAVGRGVPRGRHGPRRRRGGAPAQLSAAAPDRPELAASPAAEHATRPAGLRRGRRTSPGAATWRSEATGWTSTTSGTGGSASGWVTSPVAEWLPRC